MKIAKSDILLDLIDELTKNPPSEPVTMEMVTSTVGLKKNSFRVTISRMAKVGYIVVKKLRYPERVFDNIRITSKGKQRLKLFRESINNIVLTPQKHKINTCVRFSEISGKFRNPFERTFFLNMYKSKENFDLNQYLGNLSTLSNDMSLVNFLRKIDRPPEDNGKRSYLLDVFNMSLYGDISDVVKVNKKELTKEDIDSLLIHAETLLKQGKINTSEMIYNQLLSIGVKMTMNQWIQTNLNMAQVIRRNKGPDDAIVFLNSLFEEVEGALYQSIIKQAIGACYIFLEDYLSTIEIISDCIRSFQHFNYPILLCIATNNRGVAYFSVGKVKQAERDWQTSIKMAKKAGSNYAKGRALGNLADVELLKGNIKKAERHLNNAEKLFRSMNDFEMVAGVEFNRALKSISEKDFEGFKRHLKLSEEIAYPLPPEYERAFRRKVMADRAYKMDFLEAVKFINRGTKC